MKARVSKAKTPIMEELVTQVDASFQDYEYDTFKHGFAYENRVLEQIIEFKGGNQRDLPHF